MERKQDLWMLYLSKRFVSQRFFQNDRKHQFLWVCFHAMTAYDHQNISTIEQLPLNPPCLPLWSTKCWNEPQMFVWRLARWGVILFNSRCHITTVNLHLPSRTALHFKPVDFYSSTEACNITMLKNTSYLIMCLAGESDHSLNILVC